MGEFFGAVSLAFCIVGLLCLIPSTILLLAPDSDDPEAGQGRAYAFFAFSAVAVIGIGTAALYWICRFIVYLMGVA